MHHSLALLLMAFGQIDLGFTALLTPLEHRYTGGGYRDHLFRYRLFIPDISDPADCKPLVVWLHGFGEAGEDNVRHLLWLEHTVFSRPWQRHRYPFFLLAVQCPVENPIWTLADKTGGDDMMEVTRDILKQTLQEYPIDCERVYLSGISSGGTGCWDFAIRYPEIFAAVAPIASAGGDLSRVDRLLGTPIWAFHSERDAKPPIHRVASTIAALKDAGGIGHLTAIDSAAHDAWTSAFDEYHLLDWLLAQNRGQATSSPPPGSISISWRIADLSKGWQWWQLVLQVSVMILLLMAGYNFLRPRRRAITDRGMHTQQ